MCGDPSLEKYPGLWVQDCSAATENILVMAVQLNLGAVRLGIYPIEERVSGPRDLVGVPDEVVPFSLIPYGHPAEERQLLDRYDGERVHRERW